MSIVEALSARMRWVGAAKTPSSAIAYSFISRVLVLVINIATGIIVARSLGPMGRGIAAAITLWPFVISTLLTIGIPAALRFHLPRDRGRESTLFSVALVLSAVLGLIGLAVGYVAIPVVLKLYSTSVIAFARIMMVFVPSMLWINVLRAFYESRGDFKRANALIYIPPAATLIGLLGAQAAHRLTPYAVPLLYEAPFALITLFTIVQLRKFIRLERDLASRALDLIRYGVRACGYEIINLLGSRIDQALLVGMLSSASFGMYVVAVNGSRIPNVLGDSLNTVLVPKASGLKASIAIELVKRSGRIVFACTCLFSIAFCILLPILVPLLYGKEYAPIIRITQLLTIAVVFSTTAGTLAQAFMSTGRPEIPTMLQFGGIFLTIPLLLVFIPKFGIVGAAYALDISYFARFVAVSLAYPIFLRASVPSLIPTPEDLRDAQGRIRRRSA